MRYYKDALGRDEQIGNQHGKATNLCAIGRVYNEMGDSSQALKYFTDARNIFRETGAASDVDMANKVIDEIKGRQHAA